MSRTGSPSRLVLALIGAAALVAPAIEASGTGAAVAKKRRRARILDARLSLAAAAVLGLLVAPLPVAGAASDAGGPQAQASASLAKKVKKLSRKVKRLKRQVEGEQGSPRPPTGPAGGDLAGDYPAPSIATGAVDSATVADGSLGGADIDPQTRIALSGLVGPPPGSPRFAVLSGAEGLFTGVSYPGINFSTEVGDGGVQVFRAVAGDGSSARLGASGLRIDDDEFGGPIVFAPRSPFAPISRLESRYDAAITLPEGDVLEEGNPDNPPQDSATIYVRDDGTGLTQLVARFADGDIDLLAEEAP